VQPQKSDHLAAVPHLERWLERNEEQGPLMAEQFTGAGIIHDAHASLRIAEWAYSQTARIGAQVWVRGSSLVPLSAEWDSLFHA
jgi:hypothetical protein